MTKLRDEELDAIANERGWWSMDQRPVEELLQHYRPLAERHASKRASKGNPVAFAEYVSEALQGLWESVIKFDPHNAKGAAFSSFATWRVKGRLIEAERANDWVKPKVRAAARDGLIDLPVMHPLKPTFDCVEEDAGSDRLGDILDAAHPVVSNFARLMVECDHDAEDMAAALNCSPEVAGFTIRRFVVEALQTTPVLLG